MKRGEILRRLNTVERELRELREEVANKPQWQPCCWPAHRPHGAAPDSCSPSPPQTIRRKSRLQKLSRVNHTSRPPRTSAGCRVSCTTP